MLHKNLLKAIHEKIHEEPENYSYVFIKSFEQVLVP